MALAAVSASAQTGRIDTNYAITTQGDTLRTEVELKDPLIGRAHVLVGGDRRELEEFSLLHIDGETLAIVDGRRLARLLTDGRVRFYTREVTTSGVWQPGVGPGGVSPGFTPSTTQEIGYIQVGNGPVVRATNGALHDAFQDNPESLRYLNHARTLGYAQAGVTVAGVALVIGGAIPMIQANEREEEVKVNPLVFVGAGLAAAGQLIFPGLRSTARNRAIDAYNAN